MMLYIHIIYIACLLFLAYTDFRHRELFMPVIWFLGPFSIVIAFLLSVQAMVGLVIAYVVVFVLFMHYKLPDGDRWAFVIFAWYLASLIANTYQSYLTTPIFVGLLIVVLYKFYPSGMTTEIKKRVNLLKGDIILEEYASPFSVDRVLVYRGKPFVTLLLLAVLVIYFVALFV